jgi:hypothetical protein
MRRLTKASVRAAAWRVGVQLTEGERTCALRSDTPTALPRPQLRRLLHVDLYSLVAKILQQKAFVKPLNCPRDDPQHRLGKRRRLPSPGTAPVRTSRVTISVIRTSPRDETQASPLSPSPRSPARR